MLRTPMLALGTVLLVAAQDDAPFDALAREYEQAYDIWVSEMWRTGGFEKPEAERPPSPDESFRPRFEAFAAQGEGRATLWLLANGAPFTGKELLEQVKRGGDAEWVGTALFHLGRNARAFPRDELLGYLEKKSETAGDALLRAYARLALAEIVAGEDKPYAAHLRLAAVLVAEKNADLAPDEELAREDALELGALLLDRVDKEGRTYFEAAHRESSEGVYFPVVGAPADPRVRWQAAIEELALRGSPRAQLWAIDNVPWDLDPAGKERLRGFLEGVASAPLDEKQLKSLGWKVSGLVSCLGLAAVEPSVRRLVEHAPDSARAGLLFGLGDATCATAGDDGAVRERGLALLREVGERWPASDEAKRASGRIFRYTNLLVGKKVPDFETVDVDGNAFKLSDYEGKVTVVDFWGFW